MKKIISAILLISMLSACLFGCGSRQAPIASNGNGQIEMLAFDPTTAGTEATMKERANNVVAFYDGDDATTSTYDPNADTVSKWVDGDDEDTDPDIDVTWVTANAEAKTYTITSAAELAGMLTAQQGGQTFEGWKITLGTDIDLGGNEWIQTANPFKGEFDGGNHVIANYHFAANAKKVGFFGSFTGNASLKNVALVSGTYTAGTANTNVGFVFAQANPASGETILVENVMLHIKSATGFSTYVGFTDQMVGAGTLEFKDCDVSGTISSFVSVSSAAGIAGGYIGHISTNGSTVKITDSISNCTIDVLNDGYKCRYVSGFIGVVGYKTTANVTITNCQSNGNITANNGVSGFIGYGGAAKQITITNCSNTGAITGLGNGDAGGLVGGWDKNGTTTMKIENCVNTGSVRAVKNEGKVQGTNVGGIVGGHSAGDSDKKTISILNCTNEGSLEGVDNVGGIIGCTDTATVTIEGCVSKGTASIADGMATIGRLIGSAPSCEKVTVSDNTYAEGVNANMPNCGSNLMEVVGYQTRDKDGSYDLRYIASFNRAEGAASPAYGGFTVTVNYLDDAGKQVAINQVDAYVDTAYTTLVGGGETYSASAYGASYLCALIIYDIPAEYTVENGKLEVIITPFTTDDQAAAHTNSYTVIHGNIVVSVA